jgi:hypothetical protein
LSGINLTGLNVISSKITPESVICKLCCCTRPVQGSHSVLSANSHTADKQLPEQVLCLCCDSQHTYNRRNMRGRSILVVSEQLRHLSCICTYNLVRMAPRRGQQVLKSWYSNDGGLAAHSGDVGAPGPAAVPAVSLASCSVRNPVAS